MYKISDIKHSSLGTTEFNLEAKGQRGVQNFVTYPVSMVTDSIIIQSSKRIGRYKPSTGEITLSKSRSGGSYFVHLQMDSFKNQMQKVELTPEDNEALKAVIYKSSPNGANGVIVDNSGAVNIMSM